MGVRPLAARHPITQHFGANATGNLPASHPLIRQFGNYQPNGHTGIDIAAPIGTPIYAMDDGVVTWADWGTKLPGDNSHAGWVSRYYLDKNASGIPVAIQHTAQGGYVSIISHMNRTDLNPGDRVVKGQLLGTVAQGKIGEVGTTGLSTGPHAHIEVIPTSFPWGNGMYGRVNPLPYMQEALERPVSGPAPAPAPSVPSTSRLRYERPLSSRAFTTAANCPAVFRFARPAMPVSDVIHHWDDPARNPTLRGTETYLRNQPTNGVSAHYVGEAFTVIQMVSEANASHANGHSAANAMTVTHEWNPRCSADDREALAEHLARCWVARGRTTPGIIEMHKTYLATACPGRYEQHLPAIRARAAQIFAELRAGTGSSTASAKGAPARAVYLKGVPAYVHKLGQQHFHVARSGDTLWAMSQHFGASVAALRKWNNITGDTIHVGTRYRVR